MISPEDGYLYPRYHLGLSLSHGKLLSGYKKYPGAVTCAHVAAYTEMHLSGRGWYGCIHFSSCRRLAPTVCSLKAVRKITFSASSLLV